MSIEISHSHY